VELVITQRWEHVQTRIAPRPGLGTEYRVVVLDVARKWNVAIQEHGGGARYSDLLHQPLANSRVRGLDVRRIGEPLVSVRDQSQRAGQSIVCKPEGRPRFAEQFAGRRRSGCYSLTGLGRSGKER
jgi:hypothetical protein